MHPHERFRTAIEHREPDKVPIDLGGVWYFDPDNVGFYAGGGITYFNLKTDVGKFDDDTGFFLQAGWQFRDLTDRNRDARSAPGSVHPGVPRRGRY